MKIDFNAPAFGDGAQKIEEPATETIPAADSQSEVEKPVKEPATSPADGDVPEQKVPYSRFSKYVERAQEAERDAEEARQKYLELLEQQRSPKESKAEVDTSDPLWNAIAKLHGDNDVSKEIYRTELEKERIMAERAERRALEALRNERLEETRAVARNEETIDSRLEAVSGMVGRSLTESEELALLEIVDDYTPKDENGNYLGDTIPFNKAWEIYELKQQAQMDSSKKARSRATDLTGSRSEGEPSPSKEKDAAWNPMDWNAYRRRI